MLVADERNYLNKTAAAERSIGRWWEDRQRLKETTPAELAARIRTPVLLAHAEDDRVVFVRHARVMRDALKDAGAQDVQYLELPYGGHSLDHQESRLAFFDAMERFLVTHLGHCAPRLQLPQLISCIFESVNIQVLGSHSIRR